VEVALKTDIFLDRFESDPSKSGNNRSSRLSMNSLRSLLGVDEEAFGSLELARWLLEPPKPLATQIQELKMKVVPRRA
jgi:hypothetical protein